MNIIDILTITELNEKNASILEFLLMQPLIIFLIWMIIYSCSIRKIILHVNKVSLIGHWCLTFALYLLQLGVGVIKIIYKLPDPLPEDEYVLYHGCIAEYSLLFYITWIFESYIIAVQYYSNNKSYIFLLIIFWLYFGVMHFTNGVLKYFSKTESVTYDLVEIFFHCVIGVICLIILVLYLLTLSLNDTTDIKIPHPEIHNLNLSSKLIDCTEQTMKVYVKRCKIIGDEILCSLITVMNGNTSKVKITYKEICEFDEKVICYIMIDGSSI